MDTVRIGAGAAGFNFLPIFIAREKGLFSKHGLDVEVVRSGSTDKATAALKNGDMEIALTPPEGALRSYIDGGPLRILGGNLVKLPLTLVAQPRYKRIEDLKDASLGTSSMTEGTALYTMEILERHGLSHPDDYRFDLVGIHYARAEALRAGTLDAALQLVPTQFELIDLGFSNLGEAYAYIPDILFIAIVVDADWAGANRRAVVNTLKAIREGMEMMNDPDNDELCLRLLGTVLKSELRYVRQSLDLVRDNRMMPDDFAIPDAAIATSIRLMRKAGLMEDDPARDPAGVIDDSFRLEALGR
ncbi:MAG: ABC transporter substrate-binding protein [Defluviicoccus sp.]|nr:ABC transporter substrate-binding protein [Defluviicoccus sp.]